MRFGSRGFTLVEAIAVIAITGVIAGMVAVFIRMPMQGYLDTARRARLADTADTALRRMTRELHLALPNSVRVTASGGRTYLEFLLTREGGRYRSAVTASGTGDILDFTSSDSSFDVIGPVPAFAAGHAVVVANLGPGSGSDAYAGNNRAALVGVAGSNLSIAATRFPVPSPGNRFQIVEGPITYECDPAAGTLRRYAGYAIGAAQPAPPAGTGALLAESVTGCTFTYDTALAASRSGVVSLWLELTSSGESVRLFQQAHVSNVP